MNRTPPPIKFSTNPPTGDHVKKPFHAKVRKSRYDKISNKMKVLDGLDADSVTVAIPSTSSESCKPYHRHLRNDKNNFVNVATSSNLYRTEIRCSTLCSRKKCWPRHYVHNIKRPYLDFEKMQKLHSRTISTWKH